MAHQARYDSWGFLTLAIVVLMCLLLSRSLLLDLCTRESFPRCFLVLVRGKAKEIEIKLPVKAEEASLFVR
jgi:hypothetical protein